MPTQIIELKDGIRIEAEVTRSEVRLREEAVDKTIDSIKPMLMRAIQPVAAAWNELSKEIVIEKAEVEIGFGIEASGNFFVASTKGNVNLKVKLLLSRPSPAG